MKVSRPKKSLKLLATLGLTFIGASAAFGGTVPNAASSNHTTIVASTSNAAFGTIRGTVRDQNGAPIVGAVIALFRDGAATVRQIRSAANGSFSVKVVPGRYSLTAMANGFSVVSLVNVDVERTEELAFRFNLVRTGGGYTLPERRADRGQAKWRLRSNQSRREIFQNNEGTGEVAVEVEPTSEESGFSLRAEGTVETYFASSANPNGGNYIGLNFAAVQPVNEDLDLIFAGQTGIGNAAPQRLETAVKFKINDNHKLNLSFGGAKIGDVQLNGEIESELGQVSLQAVDEWRVRDNLIFVVGFDYSRFVGASNVDSFAPRLGLQFDINAKTRFNAAYTTSYEPRSWQQAADLEDNRILFRAPEFENYAVVADKPEGKQVLMPKLRRFEVGIERVLDDSSSVEALAFFDATNNRGVSFINVPTTAFAEEQSYNFLTAIQNGSAQGARIVYSRRLNSIFSAAFGYAAGRGQRLSPSDISTSINLFDDDFFQTLAAQVSADLSSGTNIKAVWRYSSQTTVFAIDPLAGRMAFYDPSLSVLVTQKLPTWGLPIRAKALLDARNLFDYETAVINGESTLKINSARRFLRGGIAVRF